MNYATFWQRFAALWIDFFVLLPLMVLNWWLQALSKVAALVVLLPMAVLFLAYTIYCHGRFGQTIGKRVMNIRVVRTNGQRIGWWEAWLRSSFDVLFATLGILASFVALTAVSDADFTVLVSYNGPRIFTRCSRGGLVGPRLRQRFGCGVRSS
jgi:uncharacterized RDD family membrane protein YckC